MSVADALPFYYDTALASGNVLPHSRVDLSDWREFLHAFFHSYTFAQPSGGQNFSSGWMRTNYGDIRYSLLTWGSGRGGLLELCDSLYQSVSATQKRLRKGCVDVAKAMSLLPSYYDKRKLGGGVCFTSPGVAHKSSIGIQTAFNVLVVAWAGNMWCYYLTRMQTNQRWAAALLAYTRISLYRMHAPADFLHYALPRSLACFLLQRAFRLHTGDRDRSFLNLWLHKRIAGQGNTISFWLPPQQDGYHAWPTYIDGTLFWLLRVSSTWHVYVIHPLLPPMAIPSYILVHPFHLSPLGFHNIEKQYGNALKSHVMKELRLSPRRVEEFQDRYAEDPMAVFAMYALREM